MTSGKAHGYFFCDACEELASGPRCEHNNSHAVRWVHVPLHHNPFRQAGGLPKAPVSQERGRELFFKLHQQLKF